MKDFAVDRICYFDSAEKPYECFDWLSMNGKCPIISTTPPLVPFDKLRTGLELSKDERWVFQQNLISVPD
jgi:hypothetical protein